MADGRTRPDWKSCHHLTLVGAGRCGDCGVTRFPSEKGRRIRSTRAGRSGGDRSHNGNSITSGVLVSDVADYGNRAAAFEEGTRFRCGHAKSVANTYHDRQGYDRCRECRRVKNRMFRREQRAAKLLAAA